MPTAFVVGPGFNQVAIGAQFGSNRFRISSLALLYLMSMNLAPFPKRERGHGRATERDLDVVGGAFHEDLGQIAGVIADHVLFVRLDQWIEIRRLIAKREYLDAFSGHGAPFAG
jgi:hypothetical protein